MSKKPDQHTLSPEDEAVLREAFAQVKPISPSDTLFPNTAQQRAATKQAQGQATERQLHASAPSPMTYHPFKTQLEDHQWVLPDQVVSFCRSGIQHRLFQKLKKGQLDNELELDLHRLTVKQASVILLEWLQFALASGCRVVRLVHGKGLSGKNRQAVLKSYVVFWLKNYDPILAFHSAPLHQGSVGALNILLKLT